MPRDLKTKALVLRRTNYGEADRILNLITPVGKVSVMAKGVRKPKSKLAGAIEMFTLFEVNLHFSKSDMGVLTGASMVRFYGEILKDLERMNLATFILKEISKASENLEASEFFEITDRCLFALNTGANLELVRVWFLVNLTKIMGETMNLYMDVDGNKLEADKKYSWNKSEMALVSDSDGVVDANVIKILRLFLTSDIEVVRRIKNIEAYLPVIIEMI